MLELKLYIAGKVSPSLYLGSLRWRDMLCNDLSEKLKIKIINLDPTKYESGFDLDQGNPNLIVGRNCFMKSIADLIVVNLTNDISVGGCQEMLIAKYFGKPLVGIAPKGGKFRKNSKEISGRIYYDFIHPYVCWSCDAVVENIDELCTFIERFLSKDIDQVKNMEIMNYALKYYKDNYYPLDSYLNVLK
jgi:hypothetical protein